MSCTARRWNSVCSERISCPSNHVLCLTVCALNAVFRHVKVWCASCERADGAPALRPKRWLRSRAGDNRICALLRDSNWNRGLSCWGINERNAFGDDSEDGTYLAPGVPYRTTVTGSLEVANDGRRKLANAPSRMNSTSLAAYLSRWFRCALACKIHCS